MINSSRGSISVFFSDAFDFVETEPVVRLSYFTKVDNEFMGFLYYFGCFDEDVTLSFGDSEYQIFTFVIMNFDFKASIQEPRGNFCGIKLSNIIERDIDS